MSKNRRHKQFKKERLKKMSEAIRKLDVLQKLTTLEGDPINQVDIGKPVRDRVLRDTLILYIKHASQMGLDHDKEMDAFYLGRRMAKIKAAEDGTGFMKLDHAEHTLLETLAKNGKRTVKILGQSGHITGEDKIELAETEVARQVEDLVKNCPIVEPPKEEKAPA
jgi:hypothetical protein